MKRFAVALGLTLALLASGTVAQEAERKMLDDGWAAFNDDKFKEAMKLARDVIRSEAPKKEMRSEAYALRAGVYWHQNNSEKAFNDFSSAIRLNPKRGYWFYARGRVLYAQRKFEEAAANFADAIERKPTLLVAYDWLTKSLFRQKKNEQGAQIQELRERMIKDPSQAGSVVDDLTIKIMPR